MRLNLGCGNDRRPGWVNVDRAGAGTPDQVWDLETFPWPWAEGSVDEVLLSHVLEHLGAASATYIGILKELYRVCRGGARITIAVPHPRHDNFLSDPTHVRPVTPAGFTMFSQKANLDWIAAKASNTPLGIYTGVDFEIVSVQAVLAEPWRTQATKKTISNEDLHRATTLYNNVIEQFTIVLTAVKPSTSERRKAAEAAKA
jgi:hypothetical protein